LLEVFIFIRLSLLEYFFLVIAGVGAGFINVVAGGGSLITLPLMIFMGLPPNIANGTNRVALVAQNIVSVSNFKHKGISARPYSIYLGAAALVGAIVGASLAIDIPEKLFNKILAIVMVIVAIIILTNPSFKKDIEEKLDIKHRIFGIISFFFIGIYGGFLHAGIGFIIMLALVKINGFSLVKTNSIKVTVALIYTVAALVIFIWQGMIDWRVGLVLAVGNATGGWLGSTFSIKKGDIWIKRILLVAITAMAIKLWAF
jgi:uncharacterized protein